MMTDEEIKTSRKQCAHWRPGYFIDNALFADHAAVALPKALDTIVEMRNRIREVCNAYSDGNENAGNRGMDAIDRLEGCLQ